MIINTNIGKLNIDTENNLEILLDSGTDFFFSISASYTATTDEQKILIHEAAQEVKRNLFAKKRDDSGMMTIFLIYHRIY